MVYAWQPYNEDAINTASTTLIVNDGGPITHAAVGWRDLQNHTVPTLVQGWGDEGQNEQIGAARGAGGFPIIIWTMNSNAKCMFYARCETGSLWPLRALELACGADHDLLYTDRPRPQPRTHLAQTSVAICPNDVPGRA